MSQESMQVDDETEAPPVSRHGRGGGLLAIAIFKLAKSLFFVCVGAGALHMLHKNIGEEVMRMAVRLGRDPEGRVVALLMEKVGLINSHRLRQIGIGTFAYAAVALVEGIGLLLEKTWAEYLTLSLTVALLPWEVFEIFRKPGWFRVGLLGVNVAVLVYLVWFLRRMWAERRAEEQHGYEG